MPDTAPHFSGKRWKAPNLAMSSIAGNIKDHDVFVADLVLKREKIKEGVKATRPNVPNGTFGRVVF